MTAKPGEEAMFRKVFSVAVFFTALCLLSGCAVNLAARHEQGYGIIVFPAVEGGMIWEGPAQKAVWGGNETGIGGSYSAVALEPGIYSLRSVYGRAMRGILGSGNKDLDYGDRARGGQIEPSELGSGRLGPALVRRMPIKEERDVWRTGPNGEDYSYSRTIDVSSEYRMSLPLSGNAPTVEIKAGDVLLLPAFHGEMQLNEQNCTRKGLSRAGYVQNRLLYNAEDFEILEWYCPVDKLVITKIPVSLEALRAGADPAKFPPALMERLEVRDLSVRGLFSGADAVTTEDSGKVTHVFTGP